MKNQKYLKSLLENFKYIKVLYQEYLNVNIGEGKTVYSELEKVEIERKYLEFID